MLCLAIVGLCGNVDEAHADQTYSQVYVIPISGDVDPGMASFLKRALEGIPDTSETLIVIEMDTFGGRVDSALEMVDTLINIKNATTIALVTNKAISAGALISLACNRLVMEKNTTIGDCAPITYSNEGPQMMGEKFQSPLRAKFRTLARRNGYPVVLAEAMVTADMAVYQVTMDDGPVFMDDQTLEDLDEASKARIVSKKTIVAKGELLTMDDKEALDLGFSTMSVTGLKDMLEKMAVASVPLTRIKRSWSEDMVSLIGTITPILMLIGLGALYTEIKAPGFGVPGIIGIVCLALVFFHQYLVGLADYTEMLIIIIGLVLMGFELFVFPGFGISGIAGILCITVGLLLSFQNFVIPDPDMPWEKALLVDNLLKVLSAMTGSFLVALFALRYIFPKLSRAVHGPYLEATLADARVGMQGTEAARLQPGMTGTALTLLRPAGKATIDGELYDVVTEGEYIPKDTPIKVIKVKGNRIVVAGTGGNG